MGKHFLPQIPTASHTFKTCRDEDIVVLSELAVDLP
jgi:hypothetical protein